MSVGSIDKVKRNRRTDVQTSR